jgi:hypothetical protein
MKAGSYISLARNYSFVILLLAFIALQGTQTYTRDMWQVENARRLFIDLVVDSKNWGEETTKTPVDKMVEAMRQAAANALDGDRANELKFTGVAPITYELTEPGAGGIFDTDLLIGFLRSETRLHVRFFYHGSPPWATPSRIIFVKELDPQTHKPQPESPNSLQELRDLQHKIFGKDAEIPSGADAILEADTIRKKIETPALERRTAVPGIGLEFRNGIAPWFIALTVLGLTVQIRNQIRRTFLDPELALGEPWLILDGRRGLEKIVAAGWAFALLIAPWIASGCLIAVSAAESTANSLVQSVAGETLVNIGIGALLLFGGWSSLTMVAELLRLRRLRLEKLMTLMPVSTS